MNYYRLSAYLFPFRNNDGTEGYVPGTTLGSILEIYQFDEELRNVLVGGLETVEISFRTKIAYYFSHACGPFGYVQRGNLPDLDSTARLDFFRRVESERDKSREAFKDHFLKKYGDNHEYLPLWMAVELMSFGTLFSLLSGMDYKIRQRIASEYGIDQVVLVSWFRALNTLRNLCAHHSRIWNREFGDKPLIPKKNTLWTTPVVIPNNCVFGFASLLAHLTVRINSASDWKSRFLGLLSRYNQVSRSAMGFPPGWENSGIWK